MLTLLVILLVEPFSLPGPAKPVFGLDNGTGCWLFRQEDGKSLEPWLISDSGSRAVNLPAGVRFVGFHPNKPLAALFFANRMQIMRVTGEGLKPEGPARMLIPSLGAAHPWLTAKGFRIKDRDWMSFVSGEHWYLVDWDATQPIRPMLLPRDRVNPAAGLQRAGVISYRTPAILQGGDRLYWMDSAGWYGLEPDSATVTTGVLPTLRNMEQASAQPLSFRDRPIWFVYGGDRGSLKSFGWRLVEEDGSSLADSKGIVVRFGGVEMNGAAFLYGFTTSNKIRAHLWSALSGNLNFRCARVVLPNQGKPRVDKIDFKMEESKKRWFGLEWRLDWNGDGAPDLVAGDDRRDLRVFMSKPSGGISGKARKLAANGEEVIFLGRSALICNSEDNSWRVEVLEAK